MTLDRTPLELGRKIGGGSMAEVFESQRNPNLVVKKLSLYRGSTFVQGHEIKMQSPVSSEEELRANHQHNLRSMQRHFGNYLPESQLVFGLDEKSHKCGYLIQERIYLDNPGIFQRQKKLEKMTALDDILSTLLNLSLFGCRFLWSSYHSPETCVLLRSRMALNDTATRRHSVHLELVPVAPMTPVTTSASASASESVATHIISPSRETMTQSVVSSE